jgi:hypothetical protein
MTRVSDEYVRIEAKLAGIAPSTAESIKRKLMQMSCTESVQLQCDDASVPASPVRPEQAGLPVQGR